MRHLLQRIVSCIAALVVAAGIEPAIARDYFFDSKIGSDAADGGETQPMQTLEAASRLRLAAGDRLLFRAGQIFKGNLSLDIEGNCGADSPIVVRAWGEGRAAIAPGAGCGVRAVNSGGITIQDLTISGDGPGKNIGSGIRIENTLPGSVTLSHIHISHVTCSGFAGATVPVNDSLGSPTQYGEGIFVGGRPSDFGKSGYSDVSIEDCEVFQNQYYGILVSGAWNPVIETLANRDVRVLRCRAHHNLGDPNYRTNHSGNGILLGEVDGGLVDGCEAWENGALCACPIGGPVGIWAAAANAIVIRNCAAYFNRTSALDGAGFDFDGGVSNSIIEHCTSHDNEGAGILLYSYPGAPYAFAGNVARENVCVNDGKKNGMAGISIGCYGGRFEGVEVCGNTVIASARIGSGRAISVFGLNARDVRIHDNLLVACDGARLMEILKQPGLALANNVFWCGGSPFSVTFEGKEYASLQDFETGFGKPTQPGAPNAFGELSAGAIAARLAGASAPAAAPMPSADPVLGAILPGK